MKIAGIDFSINHPSVCIYDTSTKECSFLVFPKERSKGHKNLQDTEVSIIDIQRLDVQNGTSTTDRERVLTTNAIILSECLVRHLPPDIDVVGLENLAFGASSNRLAEIAGYQYILRERLVNKYGSNNIYFFAAMSVKAKAGSGKFDKNQMIEKFLDSELTGLNLKLHDKLRNELPFFKKTKNWIKPIDDIADSYWIAKCTESIVCIK
jgi:hypothetical protein